MQRYVGHMCIVEACWLHMVVFTCSGMLVTCDLILYIPHNDMNFVIKIQQYIHVVPMVGKYYVTKFAVPHNWILLLELLFRVLFVCRVMVHVIMSLKSLKLQKGH